ncbi:MAG: glycosyltransferase family 2 protein [Gemmatimonadetes bacterium]|nr:glycosyltransferase family 2 protein [Gemmatimonadota bacterium]
MSEGRGGAPDRGLRVSVVIPTWNGAPMLTHALDSLARQTWSDFEIIVVDNGSSDGTAELVARQYPHVGLVHFRENRGFAAAVNAGIRESRGEIVVLMNNDTEADARWLEALARALEAHPEVGSCASKVLDFHDRARIDSAGDRLGLIASQIGHGERDGPAFACPRYVLSACAGAAAYRRRMLATLGLFDERFESYLEDVDLGVRAQLRGYRCLYVPDAVIFHRGSATARRMPERKFYLLLRNSLFLFFQYMPPLRLAVFGPLMLVAPLYVAVRERVPLRVGARSLRDFLRDLPAVLERRREAARSRRISGSEFRRLLASPLARQPRNAFPERVKPEGVGAVRPSEAGR